MIFCDKMKQLCYVVFLRFTKQKKICQYVNCSRESVMMSSHCLEHILVADKEQQLIKPCSFLYDHGEQCRMPVFDVMSKVVVCSEHQNAVSYFLSVFKNSKFF